MITLYKITGCCLIHLEEENGLPPQLNCLFEVPFNFRIPIWVSREL